MSGSKSKRGRCQFSLRALLLFVTVAGVGFGLVGERLHDAWKQWKLRKVLQEPPRLDASDVPILIEALRGSEVSVRSRAASLLGRLAAKAKDAVPALTKALEDESVDVRTAAALTLHRMRPTARSTIPALVEALRDEAQIARIVAACALVEIDRDYAMPVIEEVLDDEDRAAVRQRLER